MRPDVVVVVAPRRQLAPGISQAVEQFLIEEFIAQAAVERFDKRVLLRLARVDVVPLDLVLTRPPQDRLAGELGTVVTDDARRLAVEPHQRVELACDPHA